MLRWKDLGVKQQEDVTTKFSFMVKKKIEHLTYYLEQLVQAGSEMAVGVGAPIQSMFVLMDLQLENNASEILSENILNRLVVSLLAGKTYHYRLIQLTNNNRPLRRPYMRIR